MPRPDERVPGLFARASSRLRGGAWAVASGAAVCVVAAALALGPGCSSTSLVDTQVDFYGPSGLAVAPARDRDLLFIASTGGDDLRAITICNTPSPADGGNAVTTCTDSEDFQFLPGPIQVFPGSFPVGNRPVRLAPVNLRDVDGGVVGGVLVAGVAALVDADGGASGSDAGTAVALPALKLVDSVNLLDAVKHFATLKVPGNVPLDAPPIDVVSEQVLTGEPVPSGGTQQAFVLTEADVASGVPAEISVLLLSPGSDGPQASITGRCSLDIVATRLALIPGQNQTNTLSTQNPATDAGTPPPELLYVGDGSPNAVAGGVGDGALEIIVEDIPPIGASLSPCPINRRLVATDPLTGAPRGLVALALSPAFSTGMQNVNLAENGLTFPAGAFLLGASTDGVLVFIRTDLGVAPAIPPFAPLPDGGTLVQLSDNRTANVLPDGGVAPQLPDGGFDVPLPGISAQTMEPLRVNGLARDVGFLQTPLSCPAGWDPTKPCEIINVGVSENMSYPAFFGLIGLVTSTDGSVVFVDAIDRRFISDVRDATPGSPGFAAAVDTSYTFAPAQPNGQVAPVVTFATADTSTSACSASSVPVICKPAGWSGAGVARASSWRAVWHAQVPGLERQGGTLTRQADGQLLFSMPGVDTSRWTDPSINAPLMVGDSVAVEAYSLADPNATLCAELANENLNPLSREFLITAIGPDSFVLSPSSTELLSGDTGFAPPDSCLPVGATIEVHYGGLTGGTPSWLVIQGNLIHGRATNGQQFIATETRFDYPLQYTFYPDAQDDAAVLPTIANDTGVAFTISGTEPITAQSTLTWSIASGQSPTRVLDTGAVGGFAGAVITYTSLKIPGNLVFFSSTGSNSVVQIDPASIGVTNGVVSYR